MSDNPGYTPAPPPKDPAALSLYLSRELNRISSQMAVLANVPLLYAEPKNPTEGLLRSADGTGWNPGSGAGLYIYTGGVWTLVV